MIQFLLLLFAATLSAGAAANESVPLDRASIDIHDTASLQRGARTFVNYCLNCHGAQSMRYNRLEDLGLTKEQIQDNLMFATEKVGDTMTVAIRKADAREWFGNPPPDLSVIARSRGADWLYSYLRGYYRDEKTATGWNNIVFPMVAMPHVLYRLQGEQVLKPAGEGKEGAEGKEAKPAEGAEAHHAGPTLVLDKPGTLTPAQYDAVVADLVNYLVYMGEPAMAQRHKTGAAVLIFLAFAFVVVYALKREYWKDVH